jgi:hypothetical protein
MVARTGAIAILVVLGTLGCSGEESRAPTAPDENATGGGGAVSGYGTGGSGASEGGIAGPTSGDGALCSETRSALGLDEPSPPGFTANDVLAFAEGSHEATLEYLPDEQSFVVVEVSPSSESTALTVTIERRGTAALVDAEVPGGSGPSDGGPSPCPDSLEVDVGVKVATADGGFDETLEGKLVAYSTAKAMLTIPLDLEALAGSFRVNVIQPQGGEPVQTILGITLTPDVFVGHLSGMIQQTGSAVAMAAGITYGLWGYGDCEAGRVPVAD